MQTSTPVPSPNRLVRIISAILRFPLTRIVLAFVFIGIVSGAVNWVLVRVDVVNISSPLSVAGSILATVLGYVLFVRLIERRPVSELSLRHSGELLTGTVFGAVLFSLVVAVLWAVGSYQVLGSNPWQVMFSALWIGLVPGFTEEILFRGVLYRILEESLGTWIALIITSLFFGFAHLANPGATVFSSIAIALEAGTMLGMAYTATRRLWLPIGIHFAWNFMQGGVFGIKVSGLDVIGWLISQLVGPELISGGNFGAEASVVALGLCLLAFGLLTVIAVRRGHIVKPFWVRRTQRQIK